MFEIWDEDNGEKELIGSAEILLSDIIYAPEMSYSTAIIKKTMLRGTLTVKADYVNMSNDKINLNLKADLVSMKTLCCGYDNPFILIERARLKYEDMVDEQNLTLGSVSKNDLEANLKEEPNINFQMPQQM